MLRVKKERKGKEERENNFLGKVEKRFAGLFRRQKGWVFIVVIAVATVVLQLSFGAFMERLSSDQQQDMTRVLARQYLEQLRATLKFWIEGELRVVEDLSANASIVALLRDPGNLALQNAAREEIESVHNHRPYYTVISIVPSIPGGKTVRALKNDHYVPIGNKYVLVDSLGGYAVGLDITGFSYCEAIFSGTRLHISEAKKNAMPRKPPVVMISARIEDEGKFLGMICFGINLEYFSNRFIDRQIFGGSAYACIVDDRYYIIAHRDPDYILNESRRRTLAPMLEAASDSPQSFVPYTSHEGQQREIMLAPFEIDNVVMENQWYVAVYKEQGAIVEGGDVSFGPTNIFTFTLYSVAVTTILVLLIGAVMMRSVNEERRKAQAANEVLDTISQTDALTGLKNRRFYESRVEEYEKDRVMPLAVIAFDLDGLKMINDSIGHTSGDKMLVDAARLLQNNVPADAVLSRTGGDEFTAILPGMGRLEAEVVRNKILAEQEQFNRETTEIPVYISIGVAARENAFIPIGELYKEADEVMYRSKSVNRRKVRRVLFQITENKLERLDFFDQGHVDHLLRMMRTFADALPSMPINWEHMRLLARYHDIGKVGIASEILSKSTPLSHEERREIDRHSDIGFHIAMMTPDIAPIGTLILGHHDRWDGQGNPMETKGSRIPIECRLFAIFDAYDAMTDKRPYRPQPPGRDAAFVELRRYAGSQFDPDLVEEFVRVERAKEFADFTNPSSSDAPPAPDPDDERA